MKAEIMYASERHLQACETFNKLMGMPDDLCQKIRSHEIIIALAGNNVIGYLRLEKLWNCLPYITMVQVEEPYRKKGIGKQLVAFLEKTLENAHMLLSSTKSDNESSIQWHRKIGFQPCGRWEKTHTDGCDELFFKKAIGPHAQTHGH